MRQAIAKLPEEMRETLPEVRESIGNAAYRFPHYWTPYGTGCPRDGDHVCYNDTLYNTFMFASIASQPASVSGTVSTAGALTAAH